jgi:hypothetical protein
MELRRQETARADVTEPENVIGRWLRLKQVSKMGRAAEAAPDNAAATAAPAPATAAGDAPFDPASLPSIESIAADTDIVAFLRAGVPADLTRAALRRAWASDPAIRDFIGIAENQWDFNDPDAIPGFGPLAAMEDGVDALTQVSSRLEEAFAQVTSSGNAASAAAAFPELSSAEMRLTDATDRDLPGNTPEAGPEQDESWLTDVPGKRRRHGGALPR